jgi:uncharacterized LabA/DUF88 family protein
MVNKYFERQKKEQQKAVYVFIDASNIWQAQKVKGKMLDYKKLKTFLENKFQPMALHIFYYTAYPANGTRNYSLENKHKFFTFLKKGLDFTVRKKELKRIFVYHDNTSSIQEKGNMDVEMTIDVLHYKDSYDIAILFTGDSDFLPLVIYLKNRNKIVYIYSAKNNISTELRSGSDGYTDILDIIEDIWGQDLENREN